MGQDEGFLQAITAAPAEDALRLIYADWLEEQDQPERAEFIRLQCRLAELPLDAPDRRALEDREADLLGRHEEQWLGQVPTNLEEWTFRRDFVDEITLTDVPGLAPAAELFARHPVQRAKLHRVWNQLPALTDSPLLERLTVLDIPDPLDAPDTKFEDLAALLQSPRLAGLTELGLYGDHATDACLPVLIVRPGAERLATLGLMDLSDVGVALLLGEPRLASLTGMRLSLPGGRRSDPTNARLAALLAQPGRWKSLELETGPLSATVWAGLAECHWLEQLICSWPAGHVSPLPLPTGLRHLQLYSNHGEGPPITALARLECLPNLRHLEIDVGYQEEPLASAEIQALGDLLAQLHGPVLKCRLGGMPLAELLKLPGLERLRSLNLEYHQVTREDVEALAHCTALVNLDTLVLPSQTLSAGTVSLLAGAPVLDGLRKLCLTRTSLNDGILARIFRPGRLPRLRQLRLVGNRLGRASVDALLAWGGLPRLRGLSLQDNHLDAVDAAPLLGPGGVSPLCRLLLSEFGSGQRRLSRATAQPFVERLGMRFTFLEDAPPR